MVKLTFGWWDVSLIEAYDIRGISARFDLDPFDDDEKHREIMKQIGSTNSIFWQIIPGLAVVAKFAEAFNSSPVFFALAFDFEKFHTSWLPWNWWTSHRDELDWHELAQPRAWPKGEGPWRGPGSRSR